MVVEVTLALGGTPQQQKEVGGDRGAASGVSGVGSEMCLLPFCLSTPGRGHRLCSTSDEPQRYEDRKRVYIHTRREAYPGDAIQMSPVCSLQEHQQATKAHLKRSRIRCHTVGAIESSTAPCKQADARSRSFTVCAVSSGGFDPKQHVVWRGIHDCGTGARLVLAQTRALSPSHQPPILQL